MEIDHGWLAFGVFVVCTVGFFIVLALISATCGDDKTKTDGASMLVVLGVGALAVYAMPKMYRHLSRRLYTNAPQPRQEVRTSYPQEGFNTRPYTPQDGSASSSSSIIQGGIMNPFMSIQ